MAYKQGKVTVSLFEAVKICLESGNTVTGTAKFMKLSVDVVSMIREAENYDEYKAMMYEKYTKRKAIEAKKAAEPEKPKEAPQTPAPQVNEHRQTVIVQATWAMTQEMQKTNKLLELISNKLAFIVDELCGTGAKEG
jgi:replicative DNA helicase